MKGKKAVIIIILLLIIVAIIYYFWQLKEVPVESNITNTETVEVVTDSVSVDVTAAQELFNLPSEIGNQIIVRPYYTLSYNNTHEQADWVAYTIYPLHDSLRVKRKDRFREDPMVLSGSATLKDYKGSGYDRGHLAPSKAMSFSTEAMDASFFMSNMSPQLPGFNRGIWKKLEAQVLDWSKESDSLYVVTGPVFDSPVGTIGENKVTIPNSYYKTIIRFKDNSISGLAFLLENKKSSASYFDYVTSIDSIEKVTGIDFYHLLNSEEQNRVEANKELAKFIN